MHSRIVLAGVDWTRPTVPVDYPRFPYDDAAFHKGVTARHLQRRPLDVVLQPDVGAWLVSLGGLLRPLVESAWTRAVAGLSNQPLPEDHPRQFLFGSDRVTLPWVRGGGKRKPGGAPTAASRCLCRGWRSTTSCRGRRCPTIGPARLRVGSPVEIRGLAASGPAHRVPGPLGHAQSVPV